MRIKTKILTLICICCLTQAVSAQTADVAKSISAIKRDANYLYAEATVKERDEAIFAAKSILEMQVSEWVRSQNPTEDIEVCIAKAKEHTFDLQTLRGDYTRAFVYVKKSDIMPVTNKSEVVVFQVAETKTIDSPTVSDVKSESASALNEPAPSAVTLTNDEEQMKAISKFYDIEPYIKKLEGEGRVRAYGKYANLPEDEDCHIFVYDRQGNIAALLRREKGEQLNLNTLKSDNVTQYKNCGAIWLQLK